MASFAGLERSALYGFAMPGHYGRAGVTGLVIEERADVAFASVIAKRGKRFALVNAVNTAFGVALPDGPRDARARHLCRDGARSMDRERGRLGRAGLRQPPARAPRPVRRGLGPVRRAA